MSIQYQSNGMSEAENLTLHEALDEKSNHEAVVYAGIDHGYMIIDETNW